MPIAFTGIFAVDCKSSRLEREAFSYSGLAGIHIPASVEVIFTRTAFPNAHRWYLSHMIPIPDCKGRNPSYSQAKKSSIVPFARPKCEWQKQPIQLVNEPVKFGRAMLDPRQTMNGGDLPSRWVSVSCSTL
jgi:hypothetical protein